MSAPLRVYGYLGPLDGKLFAPKKLRIGSVKEVFSGLPVCVRPENGKKLYYGYFDSRKPRNWFRAPVPAYHALLPHVSLSSPDLEPVWVDQNGRAVIGWLGQAGERTLLIGLDVEEEIVRHRQGDPFNAEQSPPQDPWGMNIERSSYLFEHQLSPAHRTVPWSDHLGFFLAESFSRLGGHPLIEPLPRGCRGLLLLTGDDDQAYLEKYAEQLQMIGSLPITYFLHHQTRHTRESIQRMPPNVQLGLHPDSLDRPEAYDQRCLEQACAIRQITGRPMRLVRNHGFLNRGYLGHLETWEKNGLRLDLNYPGVDGSALNASFLPMRVRCPNGVWTKHFSLLTTFGDGMLFALHLTERQAVRRVRRLVKQIESSRPAALVFNFHPQNISVTQRLHHAVLALARRPGWLALGLEEYLDWLETVDALRVESLGPKRFLLRSESTVRGSVLRFPTDDGWRRRELGPWSGQVVVSLD